MEQAPTIDRPYRFAVGARERFIGDYNDQSQAFATTFQTVDIPAGDFTAGVYLRVDCVTAGNIAAVAFTGDGPFNALSEVQLQDPQGIPFQILSGYELYIWNVLGGFQGQSDATLSPYYVATTGAVATGGSFSFVLRLPCELGSRDGIGALYNGSTASQFKVKVTLATSATVYAVAPTALANVRVRMTSHGYQLAQQLPSGHAFDQEPPGGPVYNSLTRQVFQAAGAGTLTVPLVRKGFLYREIVFIVRDAALARSNAIVSDAVLRVDNVDHWNGSFAMWRHITWERNRLTGVTPATALATGVALQSYCHDWDGVTGAETRDLYLPTTPGSIAEMRLTFTAAGSITMLVNDVTPTAAAIAAGVVKV
jgi:hypothetical protein